MKSGKQDTVPASGIMRSKSAAETERIGSNLARLLPVPGVVLLRGDLGAGKTTLTRGIARGLGLKDPSLVNSPSFTLVNIYQGDCAIYHVDLYRLGSDRDLYSIGLDDFLGKEGVTIVEWSERLSYPIPGAVEIEIEDAGDAGRVLHVCLPGRKQPPRQNPGENSGFRSKPRKHRKE